MKSRCEQFGKETDKTLATETEFRLKNARIVLVESMILDALQMYEAGDKETAKTKLNSQVKSLQTGGIKPSELHGGLWKQLLKATKNQALQ